MEGAFKFTTFEKIIYLVPSTIALLLLIVGLILIFVPVQAIEINPSVEDQPFLCKYSITKWVCNIQGGHGTPGPVFAGLKRGSASVAFGGTVTHGVGTTPTACVITGKNASQTAAVIQMTSTVFVYGTNGTKTGNKGVTDTINWICWL